MGRQISFPNLVAKTFGISKADAERAIQVGGVQVNGAPHTEPKIDSDRVKGAALIYDGRTVVNDGQ